MKFRPGPALLSFTLAAACSDGTSDLKKDTGGPDLNTHLVDCRTQCEVTSGLYAMPLNTVVLTSDTDAPVEDTASFDTGCTPTDTDWPCLHVNSLTQEFRTEAGHRVCSDTGDIDTCVRFENGAHAYRADLDASLAATECADALTLADSSPDPNDDFDAWAAKLRDQIEACPDTSLYNKHMLNVYIVNNPFGSDSFALRDATDAEMDCSRLGMNAIDVNRFPANPTDPLEWVNSAGEHEMGHTYNLAHACKADPPNTVTDDSNIMQTIAENCCEEAMGIDADTGDTAVPDTDTYWAQHVAVDCDLVDTGVPPSCDDNPGRWNDPDCFVNNHITVGSREHGFTNDVSGSAYGPTPGQVDTILAAAGTYCECMCEDQRTTEFFAIAVGGELPCHGGSGTVAFFPFATHDLDGDGVGMVELVPIVKSGDHLGRLSWVTSVNVTDWGSANNLIAATEGHEWSFFAGDPDTLDTTSLEEFDVNRPSTTMGSGVIRTGYLWATDGVTLPTTAWEWPEAQMVWGCYNDYQADDVKWESRPSDAYILKIKDVVGTWNQQILVRPDYNAMSAWMELRGNPRAADRIALANGPNGTYSWSYSQAGMEASGWLKPIGNPTGSKLQVHLDEVTYGTWSVTNTTLPDLDKLP